MSQHIEELERLTELREQGVLTAEEFEQEKARLLRVGNGDERTGWREVWGKVREQLAPWNRSLNRYLAISLLSIIAIGGFFFARAAISGPDEAVASEVDRATGDQSTSAFADLFAPSSIWDVSQHTDPMTDVAVTSAIATFSGNLADFEVVIACASSGETRYTLTSFDKNGDPAPMRQEFRGYWAIPYQLRVGSNEPTPGISQAEYNNQVVLNQKNWAHTLNTDTEASDRVLFRLFMLNGEETVEIDQTDAELRDILDPCISKRELAWAATEAAAEAERAQARDREAEIHADISNVTFGM